MYCPLIEIRKEKNQISEHYHMHYIKAAEIFLSEFF